MKIKVSDLVINPNKQKVADDIKLDIKQVRKGTFTITKKDKGDK